MNIAFPPRTAVFAHRGRAEDHAENTLPAFAAAVRLGADGVELDVRLTADGSLVVHHDPLVDGVGPIASLAAADLPVSIPSLAEVLEVCRGKIVNIEVKTDLGLDPDPGQDGGSATGPRLEANQEIATVLVRLLTERSTANQPRGEIRDRILISSFDLEALRAVHRADPQLRRGLLLAWTANSDSGLARASKEACTSVHPFVSQVTPELVTRAHDLGLELHVWTVNADEDLRAMCEMGVDAVITDRLEPALAIAADAHS